MILVIQIQQDLAMSNITFTNSSYNGVSGTLSWSHTVDPDDDFLIVGVALEDDGGDSIDGLTAGGTALTCAGSASGGDLKVALYYLLETDLPIAGTATLVCSTSEGATGLISNAISGYNLEQQAPEANASSSVTSASTISTSLTTVTSDALLFDVVAGNFMGANWSEGSSQTAELTLDNRSGFSYAMSTKHEVSPGGQSLTWTASGGAMPDMVQFVASFESTGAGGGGGSPPVVGSITYDSDGESGNANVTTETISGISVPTDSDRLLVVHVGLEDKSATGLTISTMTFDGVAGTLAVSQDETTSDTIKALIYYWLDADLPASGTASLTCTMSAEIRTISLNWTFVSGVYQGVPEATGTDSASSDTSVNPSLTTLTDDAWVFSNVVASTGTPSFSPGASQTERFEYSGASSHAGGDKEVSTAGSTTNTWTASSADNLAAVSAAWAPTSVAGSETNYYSTSARSAAGDASGDEATFTFTTISEASKIDVFAQWPTGPYASDTPFTITAPGTGNTLAVDVDQSTRGGQVNYIGGINGRIPAGNVTVVIDDDANGTVVADMVRIEVTYTRPPKSDVELFDSIAPERQYMRRLVS